MCNMSQLLYGNLWVRETRYKTVTQLPNSEFQKMANTNN